MNGEVRRADRLAILTRNLQSEATAFYLLCIETALVASLLRASLLKL
jgi:hypothetical protein